MANRRFDRAYCVGERIVDIYGSFVTLTGSGTVAAATVKGFGFGYAPTAGKMALQSSARPGINSTPGIVRVSTGLYSITFDDAYLDLTYFSAHYSAGSTSGAAKFAQTINNATGLATSATAPTLQLIIVNGSGTPADGEAAGLINFHARFRDSTVQFSKP